MPVPLEVRATSPAARTLQKRDPCRIGGGSGEQNKPMMIHMGAGGNRTWIPLRSILVPIGIRKRPVLGCVLGSSVESGFE